MSDPTRPDDLQETAENARRIADEAAREADLERPTAAGAGGHPHPQIRHADHVRAGDDVRTYERQEELAHAQARAAEALEENAERLQQNRELLADAREQVAENRDDVQDVERAARDLRDQVGDAAAAVRQTRTPDVR